jgi:protein-L-isoaspartate O-methyltransferase
MMIEDPDHYVPPEPRHRPESLVARVLAAVGEEPCSTALEIACALGAERAVVAAALKELVRSREIERQPAPPSRKPAGKGRPTEWTYRVRP